MRRQTAFLVAALAMATLAPATGAAELGSLHPGESRFWPGSYVDTATDGDFSSTDNLETTDGGYRLRVALDLLLGYKKDDSPHKSADQGRNFTVTLLRDGIQILSGRNADGPWGYSVELFVCFESGAGCENAPHGVPCTGVEDACDEIGSPINCDATSCARPPRFTALAVGPSAGKWTIKVTANDVDGWSYRMRTRLEKPPPPPPDSLADRYLSPNLRAIPPFELSLNCTSVQGSGAGARTGVCGPDADAADHPNPFTGCTALELAHNPDVRRCLRFSGGEEVAGARHPSDGGGGNLHIEGRNPVADPLTGDITATAVQLRRAPDGSIDEHEAGKVEFHSEHGHWHYAGFLQYQLFQVTGDTSAESPPAKKLISDTDLFGAKRGWGPVNERMADWSRFNQGISAAGFMPPPSPNCPSPCQPRLFQTVGWGDFYEWPVEDQFVPIGTESDPLAVGHYLLREVIDMENRLIESDETDNTSYAYFKVTDPRSLKIIERGYGSDPWDPQKVVVP